MDSLKLFNKARLADRARDPIVLHLKKWSDEELREALRQNVELISRPGSALQAMQIISRGMLDSPFLYGLAYEVLIKKYLQVSVLEQGKISNDWQLLTTWIDVTISRNISEYPGPPSQECRRNTARVIALLLSLSDRGLAGATLEELQRSPLVRRIWLENDSIDEHLAEGQLEEKLWELRGGCLMSYHGGRFAPFHHSILVHLAAEALSEIVAYEASRIPARSEMSIEINAPAAMEDEAIHNAARLIEASFLEPDLKLCQTALESGSIFQEVLTYWLLHRPDLYDLHVSSMRRLIEESRLGPAEKMLAEALTLMREILTSCSTEEGLAQRESDQEANLGEEVNPTAVPYTGTRASPANIRAPTGSLVPAPGGVSISENDRYARHALIPGWQQQSLREARVVVVGMGAVGNEVTRVLAMAGVGAFVVCDPDRIETSNLSRTVLFRDNDIGRLKVEAAADALRRLVPGIEVDARPLPLVHGVGLAELRDASLVLACLDSRSARLQLAGRYPARREGGSETLGPCNEPVVAEWNFCPHCGQPNG